MSTIWTYHLRPGLKYGKGLGDVTVPGVTGQPIKTSDIKYAIERLYNPSVGAGYATYYDNIVGSDKCKKAAAYGCQLSGITTPDDNTIVFNLSKPTGDWDMRMTMPATTPVPQSVASKYDKTKDSDYDSHVVSNGPYYVSKYTPGETVIFKRNTTWDASTDPIRKAYPDEIDWKEGFDQNVCNAKVANGDYDLALDCAATGSELRKVSQLGERFMNGPEPCTAYLFLNTTVKPFDKLKVRQAINLVIDKDRQRVLAGGPFTGQFATSILPPGVLGHLGAPEYDPFASTDNRSDVAGARALMKQAGYGGGYHGRLKFFASTIDSSPQQVESVRSDLTKIGIDNVYVREPGILPSPQYVQEPAPNTALGFGSSCGDTPSPDTFLTPLLFGSPRSHGSGNYSRLNDSKLNSMIRKAEAASPAVADAAWAAANRRATELAALVPIRWSYARVVLGPRLRHSIYNQFYETVDFVNAGVKGPAS